MKKVVMLCADEIELSEDLLPTLLKQRNVVVIADTELLSYEDIFSFLKL